MRHNGEVERQARFISNYAKAHSTFPGELISAKTRKARNEWLKKALKIPELTD